MKASSEKKPWGISILITKIYSFIHLKSLQIAAVPQNNH